MRHQRAGRKLGRTTSHRWAMFRNMLTSFFEWEKIETTTAKAKELRPLAEKMITLGKKGDLAARRQALKLISNKKIVRKIFDEIAPKFQNRFGGYTRIIRAGVRPGDSAPISIIELISEEKKAGKKKGTKKKKAAAKAKSETKKAAQEEKQPEKEIQGEPEPEQKEPVNSVNEEATAPESPVDSEEKVEDKDKEQDKDKEEIPS